MFSITRVSTISLYSWSNYLLSNHLSLIYHNFSISVILSLLSCNWLYTTQYLVIYNRKFIWYSQESNGFGTVGLENVILLKQFMSYYFFSRKTFIYCNSVPMYLSFIFSFSFEIMISLFKIMRKITTLLRNRILV